MSTSDGVLRTRLLPARLPPDVVPRPELVAALANGLRGRLCGVVAGAGYGKTTLMALARERSDMPWVWCSCDARIPDHRALVAHLAAGFAGGFPGFGAGLALDGMAEAQVGALANEVVETVGDDVVLALDDVHLLPDAAAAVLGLLVEAMPPNVHLLLAARAPFPFPMARLRASRVVELGEADLSFSLAEADALVRSLCANVGPDEVSAIHRRTEGWPVGLILAAQSDGAGPRAATEPSEFAYLAEEVLERQDRARQEFLLDTAVLGRFTPALAAAVTGRLDAAREIRSLMSDHLFVIPLDQEGTWFRYHHLFQAFLQDRAAQGRPGRAAALHSAAAEWWRAEGEPAEAVPHLLAAGDVDGALDLIEEIAEPMALSPQAATLTEWIASLPRGRWAERPRLLMARASLLLTEARYEDSFSEMEEAVDRLVAMGDHERAAIALLRLQQTMVTAGTSPARRAQAGERYRDRIDPTARMYPMVLILLASAYGYGCRFREAREVLADALALPAAGERPVIGVYADVARAFYIDFWTGRPQDAVADMARACATLAARPDQDELALRPFAEIFHTYLALEMGRFEATAALAEATAALFLHRGMPESIERSKRWVDLSVLVGTGRFQDLADHLGGVDLRPGELSSYNHRYRAPLARLAGHRRDAGEVRSLVRAARADMQAFGEAFDDATFLCDYALAAHDAGDRDLAETQARDAALAAARVGSPWLEARSALVGAHVLPSPDEARRALDRALALTDEWRIEELWSGRERLIAPGLLAQAIGDGVRPEAADRAVLALGGGGLEAVLAAGDADAGVRARVASLAGAATEAGLDLVDRLLRDPDRTVRERARVSWVRLKARPRASIRIETLGGLRVLRDRAPVSPRLFARQKARALLGALVCARGPVHRDVLCEWLWPELPPDRAAAALRTTMHDLRRAVEPEVDASSPQSVVVTEGETVRLALAEDDSLDLQDLARLASAPDGVDEDPAGRMDRLLAAETLVGGEFLPEWRFEEWTAGCRGDITSDVARLTEQLADALVAAGRPSEAIPRYRRLLETEPERERWHRALMRAQAASGERALALRQYHACRTLLRTQQGIDPAPETRALFEAILREDEGVAAAP